MCKVGDVFGVYDGSECVFKGGNTNQDCSSNDNYACCYNKCLLTDEFGSCQNLIKVKDTIYQMVIVIV